VVHTYVEKISILKFFADTGLSSDSGIFCCGIERNREERRWFIRRHLGFGNTENKKGE